MSTTRQRNLSKAAFTNTIVNSSGGSSPCGNCTKKVSCAYTQKMSGVYTLQNRRGGPSGPSTGQTRCTPGPGFTVTWDKVFGQLYIDGPALPKGEGCNVCQGCDADYDAKKQAWISANGKTTQVKANGTWPATASGCPVSCMKRCYRPSYTTPKNDPVPVDMKWGCGPCDKKVPCTSCGKKTVSKRAINLVKQTLRSI